MNPSSESSETRKSPAQLRVENARMAEALRWIESQKHVPRAYRHMRFERLIEAAKYGLGESDQF